MPDFMVFAGWAQGGHRAVRVNIGDVVLEEPECVFPSETLVTKVRLLVG